MGKVLILLLLLLTNVAMAKSFLKNQPSNLNCYKFSSCEQDKNLYIVNLKGIQQGIVSPIFINGQMIIIDKNGTLYSLNTDILERGLLGNSEEWKISNDEVNLEIDSEEIEAKGSRVKFKNNTLPTEAINWKINLLNKKYLSAELSYAGDIIFCVIDNVIYALNFYDGTVLWRKQLNNSVRGAPVVVSNYGVAALTIDSYLYVLRIKDGSILWTYQGSELGLRHFNGSSPLFVNNVLIVPFANNEIISFQPENGKKIWKNYLDNNSLNEPILDVDFTLRVSDDNMIVVSSKSRNITNFSLTSGEKKWSKKLPVTSISEIINNEIFLTLDNYKLVSLDVLQSKINWISDLSEIDRKNTKWNDLVYMNGKLWLLNNYGKLLKINSDNGIIESVIEIKRGSYHRPILYNSSMYITTKNYGIVILS